jgi:hypothetical protein
MFIHLLAADHINTSFSWQMALFLNCVAFVELSFAAILFTIISVSVIYYASRFIEERLPKFVRYCKIHAGIVVVISFLLPLSGFPWTVWVPALCSNGLWGFLAFTGFPFLSLTRPDFYVALVATVLTHFFMMVHFLGEDEEGFFVVVCYFVLLVWSLPCLMMVSLSTLEGDDEDAGKVDQGTSKKPSKGRNLLAQVVGRLLKRAEDVLPHAGSKND